MKPRKVHYLDDSKYNKSLCGFQLSYVVNSKSTTDVDKVTCKLCKAALRKSGKLNNTAKPPKVVTPKEATASEKRAEELKLYEDIQVQTKKLNSLLAKTEGTRVKLSLYIPEYRDTDVPKLVVDLALAFVDKV